MNSIDLAQFNHAVELAQTGQTEVAYTHLKALALTNPPDANILLWIAFTTPHCTEAQRSIETVGKLDPAHPHLAQARAWLAATYPVQEQSSPSAPTISKTEKSPRKTASWEAENNWLVWLWGFIGLIAVCAVGMGEVVPLKETLEAVVIAPQNQAKPELVLLAKVQAASSDYQSIKYSYRMTNKFFGLFSQSDKTGTIITVKPNRYFISATYADYRQETVVIGKDVYQLTNSGWKRNYSDQWAADNFIKSELKNLGQVVPGDLNALSGSRMLMRPDETLNGKELGVFEIYSVVRNPDGKTFNQVNYTYKYDKKTYRLQQTLIKQSDTEIEIRHLDYDSPNNKIVAPA